MICVYEGGPGGSFATHELPDVVQALVVHAQPVAALHDSLRVCVMDPVWPAGQASDWLVAGGDTQVCVQLAGLGACQLPFAHAKVAEPS